MTGGEFQNSGVLSDRELQIVELVAEGLTNQDIAEKLEISKRTVDNHISNILTKTGTDNRVALVRWALQWGKVCIDDVNCCALPPYQVPTDAQPSLDSPISEMSINEGDQSEEEKIGSSEMGYDPTPNQAPSQAPNQNASHPAKSNSSVPNESPVN
jgi:DNA-binding CsgD family transcriptional regulator